MGIAGVLSNYQAEDGAGPMIAEQLAMNPFAVVIQSDAIKGTNGGVSISDSHATAALLSYHIHLRICVLAAWHGVHPHLLRGSLQAHVGTC